MEQEPDPAVQRHQLRMELRRARERAELTQRRAARDLGWSDSKLVRIEAGHSRVSRTDLKALLELYGVANTDTFAHLAELAEQSKRQPWAAYRDVLSPEFVVYLGYESAASSLRTFQRDVIHGLLQTEDYARSLTRAVAKTPSDIQPELLDRQIKVRLTRQALFYKEEAPRASFILDEAALRRPPGTDEPSREVLRAQLQRLKELAKLPSVTIQVTPFDYGFHFGSRGPFTVLQFPGDDGAVVYLEGVRSSSIIQEDLEEVAFYDQLFEQLAAAATPPDDLDRYLDEIMQ